MANEWLKNGTINLRSPEPEDLDLIYAMENDTALWCVGSTILPYSRHTLRAYLQQSQQDLYTERQARFIIELHDKKRVGMIDLVNFDPHNKRVEVCIGLLHEFRGQGIGRSALEVICSYSFCFLHLHQIYAYIPIDNAHSRSLFCSAGFKETAILKDWLLADGEYKDIVIAQLVDNKKI